MHDARHWITTLGLTPHPEGGWYREVYRAGDRLQPSALPERYLGSRPFATAIYFLLNAGEVSRFHRLQSDELWHFYAGTGLTLHLLYADGTHEQRRLGMPGADGTAFVASVPRGVWMGACVDDPAGYALTGCTVAPGFDYADFELASRAALLAAYPARHDIIHRLTNP